MRKIIVLEHISIDGVIQSPSGPEEDTSGHFPYGGWTIPFANEVTGTAIRNQMNSEFDLLIGRKTYDDWVGLLAASCGHLAGCQHSDQVHRFEYPDIQRMAANYFPGRRHCRKNRRYQAAARTGFERLGK